MGCTHAGISCQHCLQCACNDKCTAHMPGHAYLLVVQLCYGKRLCLLRCQLLCLLAPCCQQHAFTYTVYSALGLEHQLLCNRIVPARSKSRCKPDTSQQLDVIFVPHSKQAALVGWSIPYRLGRMRMLRRAHASKQSCLPCMACKLATIFIFPQGQ